MDDEVGLSPPKKIRLAKINKPTIIPIKSTLNITGLPPEILQMVFNWIPATFLITNLKLVSKHFRTNVNDYLYTKFFGLTNRLRKIYFWSVNKFDNTRELHCQRQLFKIVASVEILLNLHKVMEASVWRHLRQRRSDFIFCSSFGKILDMFNRYMFTMYNNPEEYSLFVEFKKPLKRLMKIVKYFINHFERKMESTINNNCFISGAKICDILDCCIFSEREILYENYENGICHLKIRYVIPNAWFTAISTGTQTSCPQNKLSWQEQQRLMYLRLRRLTLTHTVHFMDLHHWQQAQNLTGPGLPTLVTYSNSVYCGYGEFNQELFFYGNFNQGGYIYKVLKMERRTPRKEDFRSHKLEIMVELTCPLQQAPLTVYKAHCMHFEKKNTRVIIKRRSPRLQNVGFDMRVKFHSELMESTFPNNYIYVVSEENRLKMDQQSL